MLPEPDLGQELSKGGGRGAGQPGLLHLYHPGDPVQAHTAVAPNTAESVSTGIYNLHSYHVPKTTNN